MKNCYVIAGGESPLVTEIRVSTDGEGNITIYARTKGEEDAILCLNQDGSWVSYTGVSKIHGFRLTSKGEVNVS